MSDIFQTRDCRKMNNKVNGHTGDFIKRQAKKIKKQENISHVQALDKASINAGFKNWKHFLNASKDASQINLKGNFEHGITQTKPATTQKAVNPYRNLLVAGINILLDKGLISLDYSPTDNEDGHLFTDLFGYPSVVMWQDIGYEELRISVWWKYDHSQHPQANLSGNSRERFTTTSPLAKRQHYKKIVGVTASAWLERKTGKFIQGKGKEKIYDIYTRNVDKEELFNLPPQTAKGYKTEGEFFF